MDSTTAAQQAIHALAAIPIGTAAIGAAKEAAI